MCTLTGCWDRKELNDRALLLGWGVDLSEDGDVYEGSAEIATPSRGGEQSSSTSNESSFIINGKGKSLLEITSDMQKKLSRGVFAGNRRGIFLGEDLVKKGMNKLLDEYSRNPDVRLNTEMFVVKDGRAKDLLGVSYPLDKVSSIAAFKIHENTGAPVNISLADFLMDINDEGTSPTLPALEVVKTQERSGKKNKASIAYYGNAILNRDLKLLGYINAKETSYQFWMLDMLKQSNLVQYIPETNGFVSIEATNFKSKMEPKISGNDLYIYISLSAISIVNENEGTLDLKNSKNLKSLENTFNTQIEQEILSLIQNIQEEYGSDIFRFGSAFHQKFPYKWKEIKKDWDTKFRDVHVDVKVDVNIKIPGLNGIPNHIKEGVRTT